MTDRLQEQVDEIRANAGSSFKLWEGRLRDTDTLSRGQITQFCNAIYAGAYGFIIGGHRTNLTPSECSVLLDVFFERCHEIEGGGYKLTAEHEGFGIEWLRRDEKRARSLGVSREMLDSFEGFRFTGCKIAHINDFANRASIVPIYRVLSGAGSVDYSWSPWQRGEIY